MIFRGPPVFSGSSRSSSGVFFFSQVIYRGRLCPSPLTIKLGVVYVPRLQKSAVDWARRSKGHGIGRLGRLVETSCERRWCPLPKNDEFLPLSKGASLKGQIQFPALEFQGISLFFRGARAGKESHTLLV